DSDVIQQQRSKATHEQQPRAVARLPSDQEQSRNDQQIRHQQPEAAQETCFLTSHGKDEIRMNFGDETERPLCPLTNPSPQQATRTDGNLRLVILVAIPFLGLLLAVDGLDALNLVTRARSVANIRDAEAQCQNHSNT